jgi:nucleoid-associated protein YgaU
MPNDAKLGLAVGVGLVIVVAVVFFRRVDPDGTTVSAAKAAPAGASSTFAAAGTQRSLRNVRAVPVPKPVIGVGGSLAPRSRSHTVEDGDTLFNLAQRYYKDSSKSTLLYQANRDTVRSPDQLRPGTVLIIPEVGGAPDEED